MRSLFLYLSLIIVYNLAAQADSIPRASGTISYDTDSIYQISEVVVTAGIRGGELIPRQELSGAKLSQLSVHSIADALRYFSGLQIKDYGGVGGLKTVNVRSLGSHHLGVFYDGIQIGNAQNGVVDLGRFSLDNVELIRLYNGQRSQLLQSAKDYASSSTLYIKSLRPKFEGDRQQYLKLGLEGGSFRTIKPQLYWARRLDNTHSLSLSGEYLYSSGRYPFRYKKLDGYDVKARRENGDIRATRAEVGWWAKPSWGEYATKVYLYNSERGYPGASVREEPGVFRHQDRQWDTNVFVQANLKLGGRVWAMQGLVKYAYDYLHYRSDPRLDVSTMYVDNRYHQQELYLSLSETLRLWQGWSISLANDLQYNHLNANLYDFAYPRRTQLLSVVSAAFAGKYLRLQGACLHTYARDKGRRQHSQRAVSILSPSLHIAYLPTGSEALSLRAFYKQSFRLPTLGDLYYDFIGGSRLQPERTKQINVGWLYASPKVHTARLNYEWQLDAYYNRVRDKIVALPTSNQFRWTMLNYGLVDIWGIESSLMIAYRWGKWQISPRLSYTYQLARDHSDRQSPWYGGQIPYVPRHAGSLIVGVDYGSLNLNYSFVYTGGRYHSQANTPEYYIQPWYTHDLAVGYTTRLRDWRVKIALEINNLLNQQYEVVRNYPMPGVHFKIKLQAYV